MKKVTGRSVYAWILAMVMIFSTAFMGVPEQLMAANASEAANVSIKINGVDIDSVTTIHEGDQLTVDLNWPLNDGPKENPYVQEINLNSMKNVAMDNNVTQDLYSNGMKVGTAKIKDGVITLTLDNDTFLKNTNGREVSGSMSGKIAQGGNSYNTGDDVTVELGGYYNGTKKWDDGTPESVLNVSKYTSGNAAYDSASGTWIQTYRVELSAYNGNITIGTITDEHGSCLSDIAGMKVVSNTVDALSSYAAGNAISLTDLTGKTLKKDEKIVLEYTMKVTDQAFHAEAAGSRSDTVRNTIKGTYQDNKGHTDKKFSYSTGVNVTRPSISKSLNAGATDDEETWTITIDIGGLKDAGKTLADVVTSITETPGEGLETVSGSISVSDFTENPVGSGKYVATYKTKVTDTYKDYESTTVRNKVTYDGSYGKGETTADYQTKGNPTKAADIVKTCEREQDGVLTWKVVLKNVSPSSTNVYVLDMTTPNHWSEDRDWDASKTTQGKHVWDHTLMINGKKVLDNGTTTADATGILKNTNQWGGTVDYTTSDTIYFDDTYIQHNAGSNIVLKYQTTVDASYDRTSAASVNDKVFANRATLTYKTPTGDKTKTDVTHFQYQISASSNVLSKSGVSDSESSTITYTVDVNMDNVNADLTSSEPIRIKDTLPDGLELVSGSLKYEDYFGGNKLSADTSVKYYEPDSYMWQYYPGDYTGTATTAQVSSDSKAIGSYGIDKKTGIESYDASANTLSFTLPVDNAYKILKAYQQKYSKGEHIVRITYTVKVKDLSAFVKAGTEKEFVNTVEGSYNGSSFGDPVVSKNKLKPKNVVTKEGIYSADTNHTVNGSYMAEYTIDVNPDALDLSTGKLKAVDTLGSALSYYLDSVKVSKVEGGTKTALTQGDGADAYSFTYKPESNSLEFILPDSMHLVIEYSAFVNVYLGYNNGEDTLGSLTESNSANNITILGYSKDNMKDSKSFNTVAVKSTFTTKSATGSITIKKFWTDGGVMKAVKGSEFEVYKADNSLTIGTRVHADKTFKVDDTGSLLIDDLGYDQVYALKEVSGGTDASDTANTMGANSGYYYFVIPGSASTTVPAGVKSFASGSYVYYENYQSDTFNISKKALGESTELAGAKLALYDGSTQLITWTTGNHVKSFTIAGANDFTDANNWKLKAGTYTLKETEAPAGYLKAVDITFTVDAAGKVTTSAASASISSDQKTLTMTDEPIKIYLKKVGGNDQPLAGVTFSLKEGSTVLESSIASSTSGAMKIPADKLKADTEYTLTEETVPAGYVKLTNPITFKVDDTGKVIVTSSDSHVTVEKHAASDAQVNQIKIKNDELITITGKKIWDDANNRDRIRPAVTLQLEKSEDAGATYQTVTGKTITIGGTTDTESDKTFTFTDLPKYTDSGVEILYRVKEILPSGTKYTASNGGIGTAGNHYTITNTYVPETVSVQVTKKWNDNEDQDRVRPTSIVMNLYKEGQITPIDSKTLTASNGFSASWTALPKYEAGAEITYTVDEAVVPAGYTKGTTNTSVSVSGSTTQYLFEIENIHAISKRSIHVNKVWDYGADPSRPTSANVYLLADGVKVAGSDRTLNATNHWEADWTDLDIKKGGVDIVYSVQETPVSKYTSTVSAIVDGKVTVTNTYNPGKTNVKVVKVWDDKNDQDGVRPASIGVTLYKQAAGGTPVEVETITLPQNNKWEYTWTDLDENFTYSAKETTIPAGYTGPTSAVDAVSGVITLTNTHAVEKIRVQAEKIWDEKGGDTSKRTSSVQIQLLADGVPVTVDNDGASITNPVTLNPANSWRTTWNNLPKKKSGADIVYTVKEVVVPVYYGDSYTKTIDADGNVSVVVTNGLPVTTRSVEKIWDDNDDQDGVRPDQLTVVLKGTIGGTEIISQAYTLTAAENWKHTWDNLPVYQNSTEINYTVEEVPDTKTAANYTGSIAKQDAKSFRITNKHVPEQTSLAVEKIWSDQNNQDGVRPTSVTIQLLADNAVVAGKTLTLNESNHWAGSFTDLPKKAAGRDIVYTVSEVMTGLDGYTPAIGYTAATATTPKTAVVTNSYTPGKTSVAVRKIWSDQDNQDGMRPAEVEVQLYADGSAIGTAVKLNAENNWAYTWTDLDKKASGVDIVYTVQETSVPNGYTVNTQVAADGAFELTNSHVPVVTQLTVEKKWEDHNNAAGKRPGQITVQLYANGVASGTPVVLNAENNWSFAWSNLPVKAAGGDITYSVLENGVENYTASYSAIIAGKITITNTYEPGMTSVSVVKTWDDDNNADKIRPESIQVQLLADGQPSGEVVTISASDNWTHTWNSLPMQNAGKDIVYSVKEMAVPKDYQAEYQNGNAGVFTIVNRHEKTTTQEDTTEETDTEDEITDDDGHDSNDDGHDRNDDGSGKKEEIVHTGDVASPIAAGSLMMLMGVAFIVLISVNNKRNKDGQQ